MGCDPGAPSSSGSRSSEHRLEPPRAKRENRSGGQTRPRTALRFLLRSLGKRGSPFLLALLAITVGATVTSTMLNLRADLGAKMSRELRRFGPNLLLVPGGTQSAAHPDSTLDETAVRTLTAKLPAGAALSPALLAAGSVSGPQDARGTRPWAAATFVGVDFAVLRTLHPGWKLNGRWASRSEALVGASLARRAGLTPGGPVRVRTGNGETVFPVAGTVETGEGEDEQVFIPLERAQTLTGREGRLSLAALAIEGGPAEVERAGRLAAAGVPGSMAVPLRAIAAGQGAILDRLERMMTVLTAVVLALSGLCLVSTLMAIVIEREGEIGLLRSIGAGDGEIVLMVAGEVALLGVSGAGLGLVLGALAARAVGSGLFGAAIEPRASVIPIVLASSLGLCVLALVAPLRHALAIQPAAALRGGA